MATGEPYLLTRENSAGKEPSRADTSNPLVGPIIQAETPLRPPKIINTAITDVIHGIL